MEGRFDTICCILLITVAVAFIIMHICHRYNQTVYKFNEFDIVGLPYVTMTIQGKEMRFIVDSGSEMSIMDKTSMSSLKYVPCKSFTNMLGACGHKVDIEVVDIPFTVNGKNVVETFGVADTGLFDSYNTDGFHVDGLLGSQFLAKYKSVIDFNKKHLKI